MYLLPVLMLFLLQLGCFSARMSISYWHGDLSTSVGIFLLDWVSLI